MSIHAGAERNVFYILVSTETPQTTTNQSQTLLPVYKLTHYPYPTPSPHLQDTPTAFSSAFFCKCTQVLSTGQNILEVYIIYLHVYVSVEILSHIACAATQISLCILKFAKTFAARTHKVWM